MNTYTIIPATRAEVPIIVSVPHCGTVFPEEIKHEYKENLLAAPDDTDWFVDKLYDFAPSLGITMITATYSRWVIDLNRDPQSKPLYSDGRIITALCPATTFLGEPLYRDEREHVEAAEVARRLSTYYSPYHQKIQELLNERKAKFGNVLLWDCHSIRQQVETIQSDKFPDLILGDVDGQSAATSLIQTTLRNLVDHGYTLQHNHPFKGGTITRNFGKPNDQQHALQLEMTKVNYMDDAEVKYDTGRANAMRDVLQRTLSLLAQELMR